MSRGRWGNRDLYFCHLKQGAEQVTGRKFKDSPKPKGKAQIASWYTGIKPCSGLFGLTPQHLFGVFLA